MTNASSISSWLSAVVDPGPAAEEHEVGVDVYKSCPVADSCSAAFSFLVGENALIDKNLSRLSSLWIFEYSKLSTKSNSSHL